MNKTEVNKSALRIVLDDIKMFNQHTEKAKTDVEYYQNILSVLNDEKLRIESDLINEAARRQQEEITPLDTKPVERFIVMHDTEVQRLMVAISAFQIRTGISDLMKIVETDSGISVHFVDGSVVEITSGSLFGEL